MSFPIDVPDAATIDHVAIALDVTHAFMADLDATLQAPAGNQIRAVHGHRRRHQPAASDTRMLALFDDNAGAPPHSHGSCVPFGLQPEFNARLSYFAGQQAAGTWNLTFRDDAAERRRSTLARGGPDHLRASRGGAGRDGVLGRVRDRR